MAGPAPDHLPVPDDLPNAMKGYPPHPAKVIRNLEHLPFSGREGDLPKRHPLEGMVVAIVIADLEPAFAELVVPPYSVQQLMDGYHRVVGIREMLRDQKFKASADQGPLGNLVRGVGARQGTRETEPPPPVLARPHRHPHIPQQPPGLIESLFFPSSPAHASCETERRPMMRSPIPCPPTPVLALVLLTLAAPAPSGAQGTAPLPRPSDVASPDSIVAAVYDVISGPAGEPRDWDRFRSLFLPEARLVSVGPNREGRIAYRAMTPDEYAEMAAPGFQQNGFFEEEIGRVQEEFGPVVHRFSAYQAKRAPTDPEPFARGINSFQLLWDGNRWWVLTIYWTSERPDLPIPTRYLSGQGSHPPP
jgi:hypothetical protein